MANVRVSVKMDINRKDPDSWNADIQKSVAFYNEWFVNFAPPAFQNARKASVIKVNDAFAKLGSMCDLDDGILIDHPTLLTVLRHMTCPPLACDRLAGLAYVPSSVVKSLSRASPSKLHESNTHPN